MTSSVSGLTALETRPNQTHGEAHRPGEVVAPAGQQALAVIRLEAAQVDAVAYDLDWPVHLVAAQHLPRIRGGGGGHVRPAVEIAEESSQGRREGVAHHEGVGGVLR